jgi:kumamolisin
MPNSRKIPLAGTERIALPGARIIGPTDPHQLVEVSVVLKHRQSLPVAQHRAQRMSHDEFAAAYGAHPDDIAKIRQFAREYNLQVLERGDEALRRTVTLAGTAANMEKAFGVELNEYEHPEGSYRGRIGAIQMPEEYASVVAGVFGLDDRPIAHPHFRYHTSRGAFGTRATSLSFDPNQVGALYGFPTGVDVSNQTIAIIELGGGYRPADIKNYFKKLGITAPPVKSVLVDHAHNRPTTTNSADGEVMLDIEVAGAVAPGVGIAVYFAPNTDRGFLDALSTAIHDQLNKPCAVSISWGGPESAWTTQSMQAMDQVAQEAALLGITVTVAAGDSGSSDGVTDNQNHVDFPASSPNVLACGGTRLIGANGTIAQETVWNDGGQGGATGGGFSAVFAKPTYQQGAFPGNFRGVPDVAGDADPETGYNILVDGQSMVVGGTSAVAPLWAGLVVLMNQKLGRRLGFLNPLIYPINAPNGVRDITQGNNGAFSAGPGWDATTGKGTPMAVQLITSLAAALPAQAATTATPRKAVSAD